MNQENEFTFIWYLSGKYLTFFGILLGMILPDFCLRMCYSIGMRKKELETIGKTTNPTFVDLYPPFLYHVFGKGCGIKKRSGKDRCRNDY